MVIEPKRIEPGWQKRWSAQVLDLYRRAVWLPLLIIGLDIWGLYAISILPVFLMGLFFPFAILMMILHYTVLRALDHNSDEPMQAAYRYLSGSKKDIQRLLLYVSGIAIFFTCIAIIAVPLLITIRHVIHQGVTEPHKNTLLSPFFGLTVIAFESIFVVIIAETSLFITYLTLLIGHDFPLNSSLARQALHKNHKTISGMFLVFAMVASMIWLPTFQTTNTLLNWAAIITLCLVYTALCDFGYMASREMFEGQKENMPKRVTVDACIPAYSRNR